MWVTSGSCRHALGPGIGLQSHAWGGATNTSGTRLHGQSRRDEHSIVADAQFIDPAHGDYRVKERSPALSLGFVNFPMDRFGVQRPALKALARTPVLPGQKSAGPSAR